MTEQKFICQGCMTEFDSPNAPHGYQECLEVKVAQLEADNAALQKQVEGLRDAIKCFDAWTAKYAATLIHSDAKLAKEIPSKLFEYADKLEALQGGE